MGLARLDDAEYARRSRERNNRVNAAHRQRQLQAGKAQTNVWLSAALRTQLDEIAASEGVSLSVVVERLLSAALATALPHQEPPVAASPDPLADYRRDWEEVHETVRQLARDRKMPYRELLNRALTDYASLLDDRGPEQYTNPSQGPVAVEPPAQEQAPKDRAELAAQGHRMLKAGMTATAIADRFNAQGWTPDKVPKAAGTKPRSDAATAWNTKTVSQLLNRDHPVQPDREAAP